MAFDGPCDLTIEDRVQSNNSEDRQPIYANTLQLNVSSEKYTEKQPVYDNTNPTEPSSEEVYQEVTETSTDVDDVVTVYSSIDESVKEYLINSKRDVGDKSFSVAYTKAGTRRDENAIISSKQGLNTKEEEEESGWEDNVAYSSFKEDEKCVDHQMVGDENKDTATEGWEDNALYGTVDDNEEVRSIPAAMEQNTRGDHAEENNTEG